MDSVLSILDKIWNPNNWVGAGFYAIIFFVAAMILSHLIRIGSQRVLLRRASALVDPTVVMFLTQFAQIAVYILGLIIFFHIVPALNKLGTALLTGVSVSAVVFGLAAQNTLSNLVAGCTLLLYRPFHIDDLVQVATPTGTEIGIVERLTLGYTMLRTLDDRLVIVPNSLMASQVSLNLNRRSLHAMVIIPIGIIERSHLEEVRETALEIARGNDKIGKIIGFQTHPLDGNSVVLSLRAWCASSTIADEVQKEVSDAVRQRFADKKVLQ